MCGVCGCSEGDTRVEIPAEGQHGHADPGGPVLRDDPAQRSHLVSVEQDIARFQVTMDDTILM